MMTSTRVLLALALIGVSAVLSTPAAAEESPLDGDWVCIYFERDGQQVKLQGEMRATFDGDKFVVKRGDEIVVAGTSKRDTSKQPHTLDTTYTAGADKGQTIKGISHVDGDIVKFCRAGGPDQPRPTEFKTRPESGQIYAIYKKVGK